MTKRISLPYLYRGAQPAVAEEAANEVWVRYDRNPAVITVDVQIFRSGA
jgi:hypothetical protein